MDMCSDEVLFFNKISDFTVSLKSAKTIEEALNILSGTVQSLGFKSIGMSIDLGGDSPTMIHFLPEWITIKFFNEIVPQEIDPIIPHCRGNMTPVLGGKAFYDLIPNGTEACKSWLNEINDLGFPSVLHVPVHSNNGGDWGIVHLASGLNADDFRKLLLTHGNTALMVCYYAYDFIRNLKNSAPIEADSLTPREKECLLWISRGERNDQIAHRLNVTRATIDFHLGNVRRKLNARTRAQAVAVAIQGGLIKP